MLRIEHLEDLTVERKNEIISRNSYSFQDTMSITLEILNSLKQDPVGEICKEYAPFKQNLEISELKVSEEEIELAHRQIDRELLKALQVAAVNITRFHEAQLERPQWFTELSPGLIAGRITLPLSRVGVYIPGGRAIYPSSSLMNIIPAKVAGVKHVIACSPPGEGFTVKPEILVSATMAGAESIYKLGGAWAMGSMAYGFLGVPKVDKIVGPGSTWAMAAKIAVFGVTDIDMPAGPSEGFIISDGSSQHKFLTWDFLAQLEHDPQAAAIFVTTSAEEARELAELAEKLLPTLSRKGIVEDSIKNAAILVCKTLDDALDFANKYAPEHLQLSVRDPLSYLGRVKNAGSVFLGDYSPIAAGDYASGTNHVLPTGGAAKSFSGLSTDDFLKKITFQKLTLDALKNLAPTVMTIAEAEGLECHKKSIKVRL
ncbi:MAG: histidinol dehydrogenase [Deltaproteobacteria bacterium]|jgi:histidinol dehydrogenase|nr:histidinol dehydrogenase [Deltaproteobacteria bacterium]